MIPSDAIAKKGAGPPFSGSARALGLAGGKRGWGWAVSRVPNPTEKPTLVSPALCARDGRRALELAAARGVGALGGSSEGRRGSGACRSWFYYAPRATVRCQRDEAVLHGRRAARRRMHRSEGAAAHVCARVRGGRRESRTDLQRCAAIYTDRSGKVSGQACAEGCRRCQGCRGLSRVVRHVRFDATKGYHGEGPGSPEEQLQEAMQRALDDAAIATAAEDAGRQLQEPYCIRRTVGGRSECGAGETEAEVGGGRQRQRG